MSEPQPFRGGMSRRTKIALVMPIVLIGGWYGGMAIVRAHVDSVIQASTGKALPAFSLTDRAGAAWSRDRLRGKPAVLHFFRSRCHSCDVEAPEFRRLEEELPAEDATILHVMTDRVLEFPPEETDATLAHKQFERPVLMADQAFVDAFHTVKWSHVTPVTYVVDARGEIRTALRGKQTAAAVLAAVAAAR